MDFTLFILLVSSSIVNGFTITINQGCFINIKKDFNAHHPIILHQTKNEFILPNIKNGIEFKTGETIRLVCSGPNNHISGTTSQETTITCVANKIFTVNDNQTGNKPFKELKCVSYPQAVTKRTGKKCYINFTEVQIGFETKLGFVPLITTCFDEKRKDSLYSWYHLSSKIKSQQYVPRPNQFHASDFYHDISPTPAVIYERKSQRLAFQRVLNSAELAKKYISMQNDFFLSRGHLTANRDFIYGAQQHATFFYINVAPQWQTANGENWNKAEISVRNLASNRNLDLNVYTGTYGQATLPDINNNPRNLSLYFDKNQKIAFTVPELYWKIVHDPLSNKGVVLITHNNPYEETVSENVICNDVSGKINWVSWDANNVTAGYSYSCEFNEFKKIVNYIPDIPIQDILT